MPKGNTEQAQPAGEKKERKVLTPAERVAKLKADLKDAEERAAKQATKKVDALKEKRAAKVVRRDKLNEEIAALDKEIEAETPAAPVESDEAQNLVDEGKA